MSRHWSMQVRFWHLLNISQEKNKIPILLLLMCLPSLACSDTSASTHLPPPPTTPPPPPPVHSHQPEAFHCTMQYCGAFSTQQQNEGKMGHQQQQRASHNLEMKAAASALLTDDEAVIPLISLSSPKRVFIQMKQGNLLFLSLPDLNFTQRSE